MSWIQLWTASSTNKHSSTVADDPTSTFNHINFDQQRRRIPTPRPRDRLHSCLTKMFPKTSRLLDSILDQLFQNSPLWARHYLSTSLVSGSLTLRDLFIPTRISSYCR